MAEHPLYDEQTVLALTAGGNKQAFHRLFDHYWDQVYGICLHLTKSPESSRDLAQDIFLKLWEKREGLQSIRNFGGYLFTITRNLVYDHLRTQVFRESNKAFLTQYFSDDTSTPQRRLEEQELSGRLGSAVDSLSPQLKKVFLLHRVEGLSHEQIAQRLGISIFSSKTYMARALISLRTLLDKEF